MTFSTSRFVFSVRFALNIVVVNFRGRITKCVFHSLYGESTLSDAIPLIAANSSI